MADEITVHDNPDRSRYEARIGGVLAGVAIYRLSDGVITFVHTEVETKFADKGVGSAIASYALEDVRATGGRQVVPQCPFFQVWIDRHPDYRSLVRAG